MVRALVRRSPSRSKLSAKFVVEATVMFADAGADGELPGWIRRGSR